MPCRLSRTSTRTIRGTVRDEQGRPVAKAWIGQRVEGSEDAWSVFEPLDRVRERKEPFRDGQGKVVPAGALGKYFELRDQEGKWHALHPDDVRRYQDSERLRYLPPPFPPGESAETLAAIAKGQDVFEVRTGKGQTFMRPLGSERSAANRTDAQGSFSFETTLSSWQSNTIWFASTDFSECALIVLQADDPDRPIEITLKPLRQVCARVIVKSKVEPFEEITWRLFTVEPAVGELEWMCAVRADAEFWDGGLLSDPGSTDAAGEMRQLEFYAPRGRYKLNFSSDTLDRVVDVDVPVGGGPLELPDIELESCAWFRMLGTPAAEIEAVDLDGKAVRLAEYRGKVVVFVFWSTVGEETHQLIARLADIQKRFAGQPLAIFALHDSSITSLAELCDALGPLRKQSTGEIPIRFLLDRAPIVKPSDRARMDQFGMGRTAEIYENSSNGTIMIITKDGNLAFVTGASSSKDDCYFAVAKDRRFVFTDDFSPREGQLQTEWQVGSLAVVLEDQFGLPKSALPKPKHTDIFPGKNTELIVYRGKVVDLDGKPVGGATVASNRRGGKKAVETGPNGEFALEAEKPWFSAYVTVEAKGFASRRFGISVRDDSDTTQRGELVIEPSGVIEKPLVLGPGVEVTGRVLKNGKSVEGVLIKLACVGDGGDLHPTFDMEEKTDANGAFRFDHVLPGATCWTYAVIGSLADGGTIVPVRFDTSGDGTSLDIGELHVEQGRTLAGRLVCSDGKAVPAGLELRVACGGFKETLEQRPGPTGEFKFEGLLDGPVSLLVVFPEKGVRFLYRLSGKNRCLNPDESRRFEGRLDRDITDLTILLEPGMQPERGHVGRRQLDQAALADFEDAEEWTDLRACSRGL